MWEKGAGRAALAIVAALAVAGAAAPATSAYVATGGEIRISESDGTDTVRDANFPAAAYNSVANEFLVVWETDVLSNEIFEIYGQRINASTGAPIGNDFPISCASCTAADADARSPAVAYNPSTNQYLVVWEGDQISNAAGDDERFEIFGQLVAATGGDVGANDFRISDSSNIAPAAADALDPAVAFDPSGNNHQIAWEADASVDIAGGGHLNNQFEIWGAQVSTNAGTVGTEELISAISPGAATTRDATDPALAYTSATDEFLVVFLTDLAADEEQEVYGHRLDGGGTPQGSSVRISTVGTDADPDRDAGDPTIANTAGVNEFLVAWQGDEDADDETEIYGRRENTTMTHISTEFQISNVDPAGAIRDARDPAAAYSSVAGEYLATWEGNPGSLVDNARYEIWGQRLSDHNPVGSDFQISNALAFGTDRNAANAAVAYGAGADSYLASWTDDRLANDRLEIFGRRLAPAPPVTSTPTTTAATTPFDLAAAIRKCRKKFPKGSKKRKKCIKRARQQAAAS